MSSASYVVVALSSLASSPSRRHRHPSSRRRRVALSLKLSVTGARAASLENPGARDDKSSHTPETTKVDRTNSRWGMADEQGLRHKIHGLSGEKKFYRKKTNRLRVREKSTFEHGL